MPKAKTERKAEVVGQGKKYIRPTWDEYFMEVLNAISRRATCDRGRSGVVIAKDHQILATGYVGSAAGDDHCDDVGHLYQKKMNADGSVSEHCVRTVHAEQNAICQAAKQGISIEGATMYSRMEPCSVCAKMIVNAGIKRVVAQKRYHAAEESRRVFKKCGVKLEVLEDETMKYSHQ